MGRLPESVILIQILINLNLQSTLKALGNHSKRHSCMLGCSASNHAGVRYLFSSRRITVVDLLVCSGRAMRWLVREHVLKDTQHIFCKAGMSNSTNI